MLSIQGGKVYEYTSSPASNGLMVFCGVIVGIWVGVLILWSMIVSFKEPVENELIKKHEEVKEINQDEQKVNSLTDNSKTHEFKENHKIFNFY